MKKINWFSISGKILLLFEFILLAIFVYFHFQLGLTRYFDADEMAHLHWAYNFYSGLKPYTDFLYFFPPGYLLFFYGFLLFIGKSLTVLVVARFIAFLIFGALLTALFLLVKEVRNVRTALLAIVVLSFLPLPFDKFLEIRPDNLATTLAIWGMYFFVRAVKGKKGYFMSGLLYALSMAVLPKVIFYIFPLLIAFAWRFYFLSRKKKAYRNFFVGAMIPIIGVLISFLLSGSFNRALYLTTNFASASSKILSIKFPMHASHFFYPIDTYYGFSGYNAPLVLNVMIYFFGCFWAVLSLVSFWNKERKEEGVVELLLSLSCYLNFYAYNHLFPLKHAQYLIVVAPLIAFYFADFILKIGNKLEKKTVGRLVNYVLFSGFLIMMGYYGISMNRIKLNWTNKSTIDNVKVLETIIPKDEYVLDMVGEAFMYKDPYYICCIPYGQYIEAFHFPVPSLAQALEKTQTKYIYLVSEGRLGVMTYKDQKFIRDHYILLNSNPVVFIAGAIIKIENAEETVDLIASGNYKFSWNGQPYHPDSMNINIDGDSPKSDVVFLNQGEHIIRSKTSGELKIQYKPL